MSRFALVVMFVLFPVAAFAQQAGHADSPMTSHRHMTHVQAPVSSHPTQAGQSAFGAIQEIVLLLENNPNTDWSKVDIEGLRQHLIDMSNVTLGAKVVATPVEGGASYLVTGKGDVVNSIRRMATAHAKVMNGTDGWAFSAREATHGAEMTITATHPADVTKIRALSFIGIMTRGMHHQQHHLMIASGVGPHH